MASAVRTAVAPHYSKKLPLYAKQNTKRTPILNMRDNFPGVNFLLIIWLSFICLKVTEQSWVARIKRYFPIRNSFLSFLQQLTTPSQLRFNIYGTLWEINSVTIWTGLVGARNCERVPKFVNFSFLHIYFYFSTPVVEFVIVTLSYF
jgi:hypothetical protein